MLNRRWILTGVLVPSMLAGVWLASPLLCRREGGAKMYGFHPYDYADGESISVTRPEDLKIEDVRIYGHQFINRCTDRILGSTWWYESGYMALRIINSADGTETTEIWLDDGVPLTAVRRLVIEQEFVPETQTSRSAPWLETGLTPEDWYAAGNR